MTRDNSGRRRGGLHFAGLALIAGSALAWYGCSGDEPVAPGDTARVYRHSFDEAPSSIDPLTASTVYSAFIILNTYDTLYAYKYLKRPYELRPNLAASMPEVSDDGLVLTIPLRRGVRFIDDPAFPDGNGRELTAHDVVYSLKRHFDPKLLSQGAWLWRGRIVGLDDWGAAGGDYAQSVPGLRALDDYTVRIELTQPYPQILHTLAQAFSAVLPREAVDKYGKTLSVRTVGSGPFTVTSFDSTQVTMERNPGFRKEPVDLAYEGYDPAIHAGFNLERIAGRSPPFVDRVEIAFIADDASRVTSLTKGDELHYARIPAPFYDKFLASREPKALKDQHAARFQMLGGVEPAFVFHSFNLSDPDFGYSDDPQQNTRNKALRCAIIKGFDWGKRNTNFYAGAGVVFPGAIVPVMPEYDAGADRSSVTYDPDGARQLLADHGWTADTLPELLYAVPSSTRQQQMFEQFRGFMQIIGYPGEKVRLKQYATFGDLAADWAQAKLPLINKGWVLDYPDAENTMQLFYGPNASPGANDSNYRNPEYDALYEQAAVLFPGPERTAIYRRMNQMVIDDCVSITGLSRDMLFLWHNNIAAYPDRDIVGGFWVRYVDFVD